MEVRGEKELTSNLESLAIFSARSLPSPPAWPFERRSCRNMSSMDMSSFSTTSPRSRPLLFVSCLTSPSRPASMRLSMELSTTTSGSRRLAAPETAALYCASSSAALAAPFILAFIICALSLLSSVWLSITVFAVGRGSGTI